MKKLTMRHLLFVLIVSILGLSAYSQDQLLKSGPMVGYSDFREVLIWVQTTAEAEVIIAYTDPSGITRKTDPVKTSKTNGYIAKVYPGPLEYGTEYSYQLLLNGNLVDIDHKLNFEAQQLWQYRMDPPDFSFAVGSCYYANETKDDRPGQPYGGYYEIFNSILAKDPNFMVWLGDNVYLRTPDFLTERGLRHRYDHARSVPELQPLLGSVHHYATWDDHDYGPNDSNKSYANKKLTEQLFNEYWGNLNTNVVGNGGITSHFLWNDVEFFMLDDRYHRDANQIITTQKAYFGDKQIDWLVNALASSKATFKVVCSGGQIINSAAVYENYATYPVERDTLLKRLNENKIEGVLFFTGDRHHTEISKLERRDAYPLIDITCSPLTSGTHKPRDEGNKHQVKDKTFYERNFGIVEVKGPRTERAMVISIYNTKGVKIWDYVINAKDLRY
jgi:alkaline phosphatase D